MPLIFFTPRLHYFTLIYDFYVDDLVPGWDSLMEAKEVQEKVSAALLLASAEVAVQ